MLSSLGFKAYIHAKLLAPQKVLLFDENKNHHLLEGKIYECLIPYLSQGIHSQDEIVHALEEQFEAHDVYYVLLRLKEKGLIEEVFSEMHKSIKILCNLLNIPYKKALDRTEQTSVSIHSFDINTDQLSSSLNSLSIKIQKNGHLAIIVSENYLDPRLKEFCNQINTPYLLIKPTSTEIWIGPLFNPEKTPCLDCLTDALYRNCEPWIAKDKPREPLIYTSMSSMAYHLAANEIFKWIVLGTNQELETKILSYHFLHAQITTHQVLSKISCANCDIIDKDHLTPIILQNQKKYFTDDGGHRIHSADETYEKYKHLISPITGIIDYLVPLSQIQSPHMHTYEASHLIESVSPPMIFKLPRTTSGGKGKTAIQGKTSCLCEAVERFSGVYQGNESIIQSTYHPIQETAIHPESLLQFSKHQYEIRFEWNETHHAPVHLIPEPFDENEEIHWSPVWSLTENKFKWIPTAICYFSYPFSMDKKKFAYANSNGNAAGTTKEEAILQGFFELIERDAVAIWWYNRLQHPEVDLNSYTDPHIARLKTAYQSLNRKFYVIDITMDIKIPTFAAISCNENGGEICMGFGNHFDSKIALLRALTEMNQALLILKLYDASKNNNQKQIAIRKWLHHEILENHPHLKPLQNAPKKQASDYTYHDTGDLKDDIIACQKAVAAKGLEMLVLDQTRPNIGLSVVKVFVPGLRHFWNRFAPGRLYDVPVEMGLLPRKLTEQELNPIPFFF